ncbi:DUF1045 domain-containing protein [Martelella alba]|uniref:DUF1045 domain-containing protein n=1 Tax=Martelella alba TaxID=2590451 RepID=A0A506UH56_9HYPH|nr:DUF1045 domain-containing protein [Martelella alba]TPW32347.1 DUF1045 domain-containing protein [Martelella alba]
MRYAIYFTPEATDPLTIAASSWLGRSAFSTEPTGFPETVPVSPDRMQVVTAAAARYGFHATLKAPFTLKESVTPAALEAAFDVFCRKHSAFTLPEITLGELGNFFALVPAERYPHLQAFAAGVVDQFEPMRAPLSEADIARRKPESLSDTERANLLRWGYPYVFDEFRFHMTLTGPVQGTDATVIRSAAAEYFAPFIGRPLAINGLALFVEETRGGPFTVRRWQKLAG